MNPSKDNLYLIKIILKVVLSIICYLAFTLYTVPAYNNVRAFIDEKMFSNKRSIVVGETALIVDVVETPKDRERGLSGRRELLDNSGMLFIFEEKQINKFWMKDMKFSIDIIWFNEYGEIIYLAENVSPGTYPQLFGPDEHSQYVLEVRAGFVKEKGFKLGDTIELY